jgi:hypothetical protein
MVCSSSPPAGKPVSGVSWSSKAPVTHDRNVGGNPHARYFHFMDSSVPVDESQTRFDRGLSMRQLL